MVRYLDGVAGLVERSEIHVVFDVLLDRSEVVEVILLGRLAGEHVERGGAETTHGMRLSGVDRVESDFVDLFRGNGFVVETSRSGEEGERSTAGTKYGTRRRVSEKEYKALWEYRALDCICYSNRLHLFLGFMKRYTQCLLNFS